MRESARVLLASSALLAGLTGFVFWAAHRVSARSEQRALSASLRVEEPKNAEVSRSAPLAPKLPAPLASPTAASTPTPAVAATPAPGSESALSESALMTELRAFKNSDPEFAIARAREGNQRFPDSAEAPERSSILIHALSSAGRSSEARGEAEDMVNHYPDSEWVREVERFTGAHRHRNVHIDDNGRLAYD